VGQDAEHGHRAGAANISPLLQWCDELGVEVVDRGQGSMTSPSWIWRILLTGLPDAP
jgi:hypothetical protein